MKGGREKGTPGIDTEAFQLKRFSIFVDRPGPRGAAIGPPGIENQGSRFRRGTGLGPVPFSQEPGHGVDRRGGGGSRWEEGNAASTDGPRWRRHFGGMTGGQPFPTYSGHCPSEDTPSDRQANRWQGWGLGSCSSDPSPPCTERNRNSRSGGVFRGHHLRRG